jgi:F0F1-type ATP synthase assembly protein I
MKDTRGLVRKEDIKMKIKEERERERGEREREREREREIEMERGYKPRNARQPLEAENIQKTHSSLEISEELVALVIT